MILHYLTVCAIIIYFVVIFFEDKLRIFAHVLEYVLLSLFLICTYPFICPISSNYLQQAFLLGSLLGISSYIIETGLLGNSFCHVLANCLFAFKYYYKRWLHFTVFIYQAVIEEFLWRGLIQGIIFQNSLPGMILTSLFFTVRHRDTMPGYLKNYIIFFLFSMFLGLSYMYSNNIALVIIIHAIRNLLVYAFMYYNRVYKRGIK